MQEEQKKEQQKQVNIIGLMKSPDEFRNVFQELRRIAAERQQVHQFQSAIEYYLKCIDMLDIGKHLLSNINTYTKACLLASLAAAYQGAWKIQKCHKFCQKAEQEMHKLITDDNKDHFLKISKFYVTLKFQHCAILSQLNQHEKALETCKSTLPILEEAINIITTFSKKQEESFNAKINEEGVMFSRKVYGFAGQILSTLAQQLNDPVQSRQSKSSSFYFWQKNPQKNQEQLKKTFLPQNNSNSRRSILGVNKQMHWVDEFNIGSIMRMGELKTDSIDKNIPMEEYLFKDKLYQLVIQCSLAFFTIATEMRFIDSQKTGQQSEMKSQKEFNKVETIKKKYGYQEKSQIFRLSEAYHLRSIQIISANIQAPIPYLTHMIKSYDKHYVFKKKLQQITAIIDESCIEGSSIVHPTKHGSKIDVGANIQEVQKAYGNEIVAINRQTTQLQDENDTYNDYLGPVEKKVKKKQQSDELTKRGEKGSRNTVKLFRSQPRQFVKDRAKSVGKLRRNQKIAKQQNTQRNINNWTSPNTKPKKKRHKQKESNKDEKMKKTRMKLTEMDGQGELHVRTKSSTHIKFVFKKKK